MGSVLNISLAIFTSLVGVICLGAGIIGYLRHKTSLPERVLLFGAAFLLIKPGLMTDLIGILCAGTVLLMQLKIAPSSDIYDEVNP